MSPAELFEECRKVYEAEGILGLTFAGLRKHGLYFTLYNKGLKQSDVLAALGLEEVYRQHRDSTPWRPGENRWSWANIVAKAREMAEQEGNLPPAAWFQAYGFGSMVGAIYNMGKTWADLRGELGDFSNSNFVESRNGERWLSHAEASLSNFLYARGVQHRKGGKYPEAYAEASGRKYGIYDLTFMAGDGRWIDVEVWGDKPLGQEKEYAAKRAVKEEFNKDNAEFLGIHFQDCYREDRLADILAPYVGVIEPFQFDKPTDPLIHSTHWSNADELLDFARKLAASMPDGKFPSEGWLRKRGKHSGRPGEAYNTLAIYARIWLGGVRKLRSLIGQADASTKEWTSERAIEAYREFHERTGMSPGMVRAAFTRRGEGSVELYREAATIDAACLKYAGGLKVVRESLGIALNWRRKWPRERVVAETRVIIERFGLSPTQLVSDHQAGHIVLDDETRKHVGQIVDASGRHGGITSILKEIGFQRPTRYRKRSSEGGG